MPLRGADPARAPRPRARTCSALGGRTTRRGVPSPITISESALHQLAEVLERDRDHVLVAVGMGGEAHVRRRPRASGRRRVAEAQLGALQVEHQRRSGGRARSTAARAAAARRAKLVLVGVRAVQPQAVDALGEHRVDHARAIGRRPERRDDLRPATVPHRPMVSRPPDGDQPGGPRDVESSAVSGAGTRLHSAGVRRAMRVTVLSMLVAAVCGVAAGPGAPVAAAGNRPRRRRPIGRGPHGGGHRCAGRRAQGLERPAERGVARADLPPAARRDQPPRAPRRRGLEHAAAGVAERPTGVDLYAQESGSEFAGSYRNLRRPVDRLAALHRRRGRARRAARARRTTAGARRSISPSPRCARSCSRSARGWAGARSRRSASGGTSTTWAASPARIPA